MRHEIAVEKEIQNVKDVLEDVHRILTTTPEYDPHQPIKHALADAQEMSKNIGRAIDKLENII